ncbi:OmpH family outer membrane protein [Paracoccus sp. WLY502]|uniref:OmpH family outer membrane protein n=1 Tax=Paracoccus yibinensis TaxID=3068891 RepID=UPI0027967400|nr:OmpH family outer membrane protein [Paracoccus sp. WLY502]MDQ1899142.1 OmpH family outer membrane protein [Paracoccus sp. WLY502]
MRIAKWIGLCALLALPGAAAGQQTPEQEQPAAPELPSRTIQTPANAKPLTAPILTVDQDVLFAASDWGNRTQRVLEQEGSKIETENQRLAAQLSAEEATLTEQRGTLDPAEFRRRAEAFDTRATEVRRQRAQVVQDLNAWAEADRAAFYRAALPLMGEMMQERNAVAVLDRRTVFVSMDAIDMTQDLVQRLNAELGDGSGTVPLPVLDGKQPREGAPDDR